MGRRVVDVDDEDAFGAQKLVLEWLRLEVEVSWQHGSFDGGRGSGGASATCVCIEWGASGACFRGSFDHPPLLPSNGVSIQRHQARMW